ncbi:hypothetical protein BJ875DRAFT_484466 [Amylocarpus encephaloides]|uniref:beta-glucosidase n=1 Tax=Amylocarpus encephaloides TaxID=45428 RepID=A0A9P8C6L3_9HELO|nr:hypothetical protein BJ875DRAFT_484466 [Amylocarpus encephaloides]
MVRNVNNTIPLNAPRFVSIFGYDAEAEEAPWTNPPRFGGGYEVNFGWNKLNGTLIVAGGSGRNISPCAISLFKVIQARIIANQGTLRWDLWSENPIPDANTEDFLVFINPYTSEAWDRTTFTDKFSDKLVRNSAGNFLSTVVAGYFASPKVAEP